ncbi:YceI family protein [Terrimonas sp. NA20]|uniref:YceI family protein n=1 Tax=Terrimonas ginsenosidimutans TaxID=2908004 RepID=A0ABS9KLN7_9BACT|nr:YceI family protein [Terrimonas ginsenosidimutans]MCG2613242.1 YceI family protein [Terrimonas ginsenosidimutans]
MIKRAMSVALCMAVIATSCNKDKDDDTTTYQVNEDNSVAEWTGRSTPTTNKGFIGVSKTAIKVRNGNIVGGSFIMPVSSLQVTSAPPPGPPVLLNHLKTADFFNLVLHPNAGFEFKKIETFTGNEPALPGSNFRITGDFTLIGSTREISFPAKVTFAGDSLHVESTFKIDRTKWGMTYHADPIHGNDQIFPEVDIHLKLHAGK